MYRKFGNRYRRIDIGRDTAVSPKLLCVTALPLIAISLSTFLFLPVLTGEEKVPDIICVLGERKGLSASRQHFSSGHCLENFYKLTH